MPSAHTIKVMCLARPPQPRVDMKQPEAALKWGCSGGFADEAGVAGQGEGG